MCVGNSLRLVTHRLAIMLLEQLLSVAGAGPALQDHHVALVESIYEAAILQLRLFYKGSRDEIFLDMFEDEYRNEEVGTGQSELVPLSVRVVLACVHRPWRCGCSTCCRKAPCCCPPPTRPSPALSSHGDFPVARTRGLGR